MRYKLEKLKMKEIVGGFTERDINSKALLNTDKDSFLKYKIQKSKFQNGPKDVEKPYPVFVAKDHDFENESEEIEPIIASRSVTDPELLKMLQDLRRKVAKQNNLPPYVIFQDISLEEMATRFPISEEEFTNLTGVSKGKYQRYGKQFSDLISTYVEQNDMIRPEDIVVKSVVKKSTNKVKIIQCIDQRLPLEDICKNLNLKKHELVEEIESIVNSGTRINIDYYVKEQLDEELLTDIYDYFRNSESDSLLDAYKEFKDDEVEMEDLQLVRIKFLSEMAN